MIEWLSPLRHVRTVFANAPSFQQRNARGTGCLRNPKRERLNKKGETSMKKTLSLMLMLALLTIIAIPAVGAAAPKVSIT